jgi:signal transduction histidine kinase
VESTLPPPPLVRRPPGGDLLGSISRASFAEILRILGGGVWQAYVQPFQLIDWTWGRTEGPGDAVHLFPTATGDAPPAWDALIYPPDRAQFQQALAEDGRGEGPIDYRIVVQEGELLWVRQWLLERGISPGTGRPIVTGLVRVVSEEKRLQWEVMKASERERARLGQEIHDDVCQVLAGINCLTHLLHQRLLKVRPEEAAELERINLEIQAGLERTRALAHGLLPSKSDFNTLPQALRDLSSQLATRFNLQLHVQLPTPGPSFSRECLLHLYRIVQEASSNAFKHGRATRIDVTFGRRDGWDVLAIQDNGTGIPLEATRAEGVGLSVMRNRAAVLGGCLQVGNGPRGGGRVEILLPLSAAPAGSETEVPSR